MGSEVVTLSAPVPGAPRPLKTPTVAERKLRSGLRLYAVRQPGVPKVEAQLIVPFGRGTPAGASELLVKTLTSGTSKHSSVEIAIELQRLGASLDAGASADALTVGGSVLAPNLESYFSLLAEILTDAVYPKDEIAVERDRVLQEIQIARSNPQTLAQEAVRRRMFGKHPYGTVLPPASAVEKIARATITRVHAERVQPREATMVIVGDVRPGRTLDLVE